MKKCCSIHCVNFSFWLTSIVTQLQSGQVDLSGELSDSRYHGTLHQLQLQDKAFCINRRAKGQVLSMDVQIHKSNISISWKGYETVNLSRMEFPDDQSGNNNEMIIPIISHGIKPNINGVKHSNIDNFLVTLPESRKSGYSPLLHSISTFLYQNQESLGLINWIISCVKLTCMLRIIIAKLITKD